MARFTGACRTEASSCCDPVWLLLETPPSPLTTYALLSLSTQALQIMTTSIAALLNKTELTTVDIASLDMSVAWRSWLPCYGQIMDKSCQCRVSYMYGDAAGPGCWVLFNILPTYRAM